MVNEDTMLGEQFWNDKEYISPQGKIRWDKVIERKGKDRVIPRCAAAQLVDTSLLPKGMAWFTVCVVDHAPCGGLEPIMIMDDDGEFVGF